MIRTKPVCFNYEKSYNVVKAKRNGQNKEGYSSELDDSTENNNDIFFEDQPTDEYKVNIFKP